MIRSHIPVLLPKTTLNLKVRNSFKSKYTHRIFRKDLPVHSPVAWKYLPREQKWTYTSVFIRRRGRINVNFLGVTRHLLRMAITKTIFVFMTLKVFSNVQNPTAIRHSPKNKLWITTSVPIIMRDHSFASSLTVIRHLSRNLI